MDVGPAELMIVLLIALLIFGGTKLPSLARSMGQAAHEFRQGIAGGGDEPEAESKAEPKTESKAELKSESEPTPPPVEASTDDT